MSVNSFHNIYELKTFGMEDTVFSNLSIYK